MATDTLGWGVGIVDSGSNWRQLRRGSDSMRMRCVCAELLYVVTCTHVNSTLEPLYKGHYEGHLSMQDSQLGPSVVPFIERFHCPPICSSLPRWLVVASLVVQLQMSTVIDVQSSCVCVTTADAVWHSNSVLCVL